MLAGLHGYDTIGREVLLMFLHSLTKEFNQKQERAMKLLKGTRIHIVPMVLVEEMDLAEYGDCTGSQFPKDAEDIYHRFPLEKVNFFCSRLFIKLTSAVTLQKIILVRL